MPTAQHEDFLQPLLHGHLREPDLRLYLSRLNGHLRVGLCDTSSECSAAIIAAFAAGFGRREASCWRIPPLRQPRLRGQCASRLPPRNLRRSLLRCRQIRDAGQFNRVTVKPTIPRIEGEAPASPGRRLANGRTSTKQAYSYERRWARARHTRDQDLVPGIRCPQGISLLRRPSRNKVVMTSLRHRLTS